MKRLFVEAPLPFDEALQWVTDDEIATARNFAATRSEEYLAWRAIVRREVGRDAAIGYNAIGAPVLTNYPYHLAVSHCRGGAADCRKLSDGSGRIAVAISDAPCAVDIEPIDRDFRRVLSRYLTPEEQRLSTHPLYPAIAWCAKETLYKYAGHRELGLLRDLRIDRISFPEESDNNAVCADSGSSAGHISDLPENLSSDICCGRLWGRCADAETDITATSPLQLYFYQDRQYIVVFRFESDAAY